MKLALDTTGQFLAAAKCTAIPISGAALVAVCFWVHNVTSLNLGVHRSPVSFTAGSQFCKSIFIWKHPRHFSQGCLIVSSISTITTAKSNFMDFSDLMPVTFPAREDILRNISISNLPNFTILVTMDFEALYIHEHFPQTWTSRHHPLEVTGQ